MVAPLQPQLLGIGGSGKATVDPRLVFAKKGREPRRIAGRVRLPLSATNPLRRRGAPQSALAVAETGTSSDNRVPSGPLSMVSAPPRLRARVSMLVSPRPRR